MALLRDLQLVRDLQLAFTVSRSRGLLATFRLELAIVPARADQRRGRTWMCLPCQEAGSGGCGTNDSAPHPHAQPSAAHHLLLQQLLHRASQCADGPARIPPTMEVQGVPGVDHEATPD